MYELDCFLDCFAAHKCPYNLQQVEAKIYGAVVRESLVHFLKDLPSRAIAFVVCDSRRDPFILKVIASDEPHAPDRRRAHQTPLILVRSIAERSIATPDKLLREPRPAKNNMPGITRGISGGRDGSYRTTTFV